MPTRASTAAHFKLTRGPRGRRRIASRLDATRRYLFRLFAQSTLPVRRKIQSRYDSLRRGLTLPRTLGSEHLADGSWVVGQHVCC
jgi:hypothetical protein